MKCPFCGFSDDRVLDTRVQKEGEHIRRRRECLACKGRFTTLEMLMEVFPLIIKKDGRREAFNKEKIFKGVQAACQKRPVALAQVEQIVERVAKWALDTGEREIAAHRLGQRVMKELRVLDDVAYVRFASVYKTFKDLSDFVEGLQDETPPSSSSAELS